MIRAKHGSRSRYVNYRCRCEPCTRANRDYMRPWMARQRVRKPHAR